MGTKLSTHLRLFRADRPDEWTMNEFIQKAEKLEQALSEAKELIYDVDAHGVRESHPSYQHIEKITEDLL